MDIWVAVGLILAVVGIGVSLYFGAGKNTAKVKQRQNSDGKSISIQSGRDTNLK